MFKINIKNFIIILFTITFVSFLSTTYKVYAGSWQADLNGFYYLDDLGNRVLKQWRWIDDDGNGIAECFRFNEFGYVVTNQTFPGGLKVNDIGQLYDDQGIVYVFYQSKKRFFPNADDSVRVELPKPKNISTRSEATPSNLNPENIIDSTNKKLIKGVAAGDTTNLVGPKGQAPKKASESAPSLRIISKGTNLLKKMKTVPTAKYENKGFIDTIAMAEERDIEAMGGIQPGKNLSNFVTVGTKFTKEVASTKIFGGSTWKHCMLLSGNEAYVKFDVKGYNYLTVEVAEQSHVVSDDNETYTYIEVFEDGESIATYDGFNDSDPETIEIYFDENETKTIAFKLFVSGTYTTRKVYLRNGRLRKIRDEMEPEHNAVKTELNEFGILVRSTGTAPAYIETSAQAATTAKKPVTNVIKKKTEGEETTTTAEIITADQEPTAEAETEGKSGSGESKAKIETKERRRNQTSESNEE